MTCKRTTNDSKIIANKTTHKYTDDFRHNAVEMVSNIRSDHNSLWSAINFASRELGCSAHSLLEWVKRAET